MALPQKLPYDLMLTRWAAILNPVVDNPLLGGVAINGIQLDVGVPKVIQNPLQRVPQGWIITDNLVFCDIKRTQPFNAKTLTLETSVSTTISIWLY